MTSQEKRPSISFHLEAERCAKGMSMLVSGIIGVSDFSDDNIILLSHGGRVSVSGKRLALNIYENNTAEIVGKPYCQQTVHAQIECRKNKKNNDDKQ